VEHEPANKVQTSQRPILWPQPMHPCAERHKRGCVCVYVCVCVCVCVHVHLRMHVRTSSLPYFRFSGNPSTAHGPLQSKGPHPKSWRAIARAVEVFPVPGGP
jgi:hypothetical protein